MKKLLRNLALILFGLFLTPPLLVLAMRWIPPATSMFILTDAAPQTDYRWVPRELISDQLALAVIAAEDQKFATHWGFDFEAIDRALAHNETHRRKRGASTISQQLAKNLFLWRERSWLRKGLEVTFTVLIETLWSKRRLLEVYLNLAEFGPGIYGAEAAAQRFFRKPAARLSAHEAALLVAVLPNPLRMQAARPSAYVLARAETIEQNMRRLGRGYLNGL